jgi:hypothetical protein
VAKVFVYYWALDCALFDGHPAELGLDAADMKSDYAHHHGAWRVAEIFEGAAEQFVDLPVSLLTCGTAVVDVLAAGAELARLGTDSTLIIGDRHDVRLG